MKFYLVLLQGNIVLKSKKSKKMTSHDEGSHRAAEFIYFIFSFFIYLFAYLFSVNS